MIRHALGVASALTIAACGGSGNTPLDGSLDSGGDGAVVLTGYRGACDGSASVELDSGHFLSLNDETQTWRIYGFDADGPAVQSGGYGQAIGVSGEADVEGAAVIGNRVYAIGTHGRDKNGNLETDRYRFFAFDVTGTAPSATLTVAGYSSTLLQAMLVAGNYTTDDAAARMLIDERANLSVPTDVNLAPKANGTSIEGLCVMPDGASLAIGFRNPLLSSDALVITLMNPAAVITGSTPVFGQIIHMDLDGLGIRGMNYDEERDLIWIVAGPTSGANGPFALYKWSGVPAEAPVFGVALVAPTNSAPEGIIPIAGTTTLRVLYDQSAEIISGTECKELNFMQKRFTDSIITAP